MPKRCKSSKKQTETFCYRKRNSQTVKPEEHGTGMSANFDEDGTGVKDSEAQAGHVRDSRYLAVITEDDKDLFALIADCDNSTVLMLDDNIKLCNYNILLNNQHYDILNPNRILYVEEIKELIVGQHNGLSEVLQGGRYEPQNVRSTKLKRFA